MFESISSCPHEEIGSAKKVTVSLHFFPVTLVVVAAPTLQRVGDVRVGVGCDCATSAAFQVGHRTWVEDRLSYKPYYPRCSLLVPPRGDRFRKKKLPSYTNRIARITNRKMMNPGMLVALLATAVSLEPQ
jgi:hypothetical protein